MIDLCELGLGAPSFSMTKEGGALSDEKTLSLDSSPKGIHFVSFVCFVVISDQGRRTVISFSNNEGSSFSPSISRGGCPFCPPSGAR